MELAQLVEPNKEPKTDKLSVLAEAIRTVRQLQVENHQLKQLNKFLEVRRACCICWGGCSGHGASARSSQRFPLQT